MQLPQQPWATADQSLQVRAGYSHAKLAQTQLECVLKVQPCSCEVTHAGGRACLPQIPEDSEDA